MGVPSGPDACTPGTNGTAFPFCDASLSVEERLNDLVQRVELDEIAYQLTARQSTPIERLGVPSYYWGTNAIHGMQNVQCLKDGQCPTSFPAPCALSASFNMSLVHEMGEVIGRELRAYVNGKVHNSLDTWSPTININRDPRCGRNVESPGEDPFVAAQYGIAYTQGLQQYTGTEKVVQAVVTLKHFFAYSIENYDGVQRSVCLSVCLSVRPPARCGVSCRVPQRQPPRPVALRCRVAKPGTRATLHPTAVSRARSGTTSM